MVRSFIQSGGTGQGRILPSGWGGVDGDGMAKDHNFLPHNDLQVLKSG